MNTSKSEKIIKIIYWLGLFFFLIGCSISITLEETGVVIILFAFIAGIFSKQWGLKNTSLTIPILIFIAGHLLSSFVASPTPLTSLKDNLHNLWNIILFYMLISILERKDLFLLFKILVFPILISAIYGILQFFYGINLLGNDYLTPQGHNFLAFGFVGLHLTFGGIMSMATFLFLGIGLETEDKRWKILFLLTSVITFVACIASLSRSAFVGLAGGALFFTLYNLKRIWKILIPFAIISGLLIIYSPAIQEQIISIPNIKINPRSEVWETAINAIKQNPVFGIGGGRFWIEYDNFRLNNRWSKQGHPHNDILGSYLTAGIIGMIGYLSIFGMLVFLGIKGWLENNKNFLLLGATAAVVTMFFQGFSQCYFMTAYNLWFFWFTAALLIIIYNGRKETTI